MKTRSSDCTGAVVFRFRITLALAALVFAPGLAIAQSPESPAMVADQEDAAETPAADEANAADAPVAEKSSQDTALDLPVPSDDDEAAGQSDLDAALSKKIAAKTPEQLEEVTGLLKSALAKGVKEEDVEFAKKMLGSILLDRAEARASSLGRLPGRQALRARDEALELLNRATANDPSLVEAYLLIARLSLLTQGNRQQITDATTKAIALLGDDPRERSAALTLRALTQTTREAKIADLDAAIDDDAKNTQALQARATLRAAAGEVDGAIEDLRAVLEIDPTNQSVAEAAVTQLAQQDRTEDALDLLSKTIEAKPSEGLYRLRAILFRMEGEEKRALADLNKAIAMQPKDPVALLQRAEIFLSNGDIAGAKQDLKSASDVSPRVADADQAITVRMLIAVEEKRFSDAIVEIQRLVDRNPSNEFRQLQLANLYTADKRPRMAVEALTRALDKLPESTSLLRTRADTRLAVGQHAGAVKDYETALDIYKASSPEKLEKQGDDVPGDREVTGILNNLSWVLATSPDASVRDAKRALKYGRQAARLTDFSAPHILSTLAAAFAEGGDFVKARKWSAKAVELNEEALETAKQAIDAVDAAEKNQRTVRALEADVEREQTQLGQLREELKSYEAEKPWREKQETEVNEKPILAPEDLLDT